MSSLIPKFSLTISEHDLVNYSSLQTTYPPIEKGGIELSGSVIMGVGLTEIDCLLDASQNLKIILDKYQNRISELTYTNKNHVA